MRSERLRTLYLEANGSGSQIIWVDTLLRGVLRYGDGAQPPQWLRRSQRARLMFAELRDVHAKLSYIADWRSAFLASNRLAVDVCNINNLVSYGARLLKLANYDLIVVSHAAAGDDLTVLTKSAGWFDRRRAPLAVFLGNEYDLLDEKIEFIRQTGAEYVCTQLPSAAANYLYGTRTNARIVEMPHALNPLVYRETADSTRDVDIGFIGDIYWPFVGDRERTDLIEHVEKKAESWGMRIDIRRQRVDSSDWNRFLNRCHGIVGAESGTYYLNEAGKLLDRARTYNLKEAPTASFEDVFEKFYRGVPREISGKSVSSRHFEPIGAKSCQILLEGEYNGILRANEHYIAVKRDLSDIEEAIGRFRDEGFRKKVVDQAFDYVMSEHTYAHRVARFLRVLEAGR